MKNNLYRILGLFFFPFVLHGQQAGTLDTVYISYQNIRKTPYLVLSDTTDNTLAEKLMDSAAFQLRIYGKGMVAGISIRGGDPSHTQVLWQGIPVNSPLNGQTDLNTVNLFSFDRIALYTGGNAVAFGSGAVSGAIDLQALPDFSKRLHALMRLTYGQYGEKTGAGKISWSHRRWNIKVSFLNKKDQNVFRWNTPAYINRNGAITQTDYATHIFYKGKKSFFRLHFQDTRTGRELSGTLYSQSQSYLKNHDTRFATGWDFKYAFMHSFLKTGFIKEHYQYYYIRGGEVSGEGKAGTFYLETGGEKKWNTRFSTHVMFTLKNTTGKTLNFSTRSRLVKSLHINQTIHLPVVNLKGGIRLSQYAKYQKPVTTYYFSMYKQWHHFHLKAGMNTFFRLPTFNDLYWQPGGNPSLVPETGREWEASVQYKHKHISLGSNFFYRRVNNLIRWLPGNDNLWHPQNIEKISGSGAEMYGNTHFIRKPWRINPGFRLTYQHIINESTGKFLIYTPKLIITAGIPLQYKNMYLKYGYRYQSYYFTNPSNTDFVREHHLHAVEAGVKFPSVEAGFRVDNLLNTYYQLMPARPMPGRTFRLFLTYKINH